MWLSHWQSKNSFSTNINEDAFLREFFFGFFQNWLSKYHLSTYRQKLNLKNVFRVKNFLNFNVTLLDKKFVKIFSKSVGKKFPYYLSQINIIKYSDYICVYMNIYVPNVWKIRFKKKKKFKKKFNQLLTIYKYKSNINYIWSKKNFFLMLEIVTTSI